MGFVNLAGEHKRNHDGVRERIGDIVLRWKDSTEMTSA
jgi:hypothetical protein